MLTCYKYRSGQAAIRCLTDGCLYFSPPHELNDALEAKFDLVDAAQFWAAVKRAFGKLAPGRPDAGELVLSAPMPVEFKEINDREGGRFYEACQQVGIFSTATRPDSQPMWAYYGDNSNGVCFELAWSDEIMMAHQLWPSRVQYTDAPRKFNRADDMCEMLLAIGADKPEWTIKQIFDFSMTEPFRRRYGIAGVARAVSIKHSDWQHEDEIRLLSPRARAIPILADTLKRVFFMNTMSNEWGEIMKLLYERYPGVELAQVKFHHKETFVCAKEYEFRLFDPSVFLRSPS